MKDVKISYTCKACGTEIEVTVTPCIPAQVSGPPENCYPAEGGEVEPEKCDCGHPVDQDECHEKIAEKQRDAFDDYPDKD